MPYSREIELPKTKRDGLANFVQMIINRLEGGESREALLQAVDLLDSIQSGVYDDAMRDARGADALAREMQIKHAADIAAAAQDGYERGVAAEKSRIASALGLFAAAP